MTRSPLDRRFLVVVGKGGVGRSSVSAALALALARAGKRVLVAMCNVRERLSYLLEVDPIGAQIRAVLPGVDAVNMEPSAALEEYGMMILKVRALYRLIFENRLVSGFLRATPGIDAWAMLGKAQFHAFETRPDGTPRYDTVIVDAPATGHGLDFLRVPRVILDVVPPGLLRGEAERAWGLFTDPARAGVVLVAIPEELPTNETVELHDTLRAELRLPIAGLIVNQVWPRLFTDADGAMLEALPLPAVEEAACVVRASRSRARREAAQAVCLERLRREIPAPCLELPALFTRDLRRREIETLAGHLPV
jgi:anion-transporting  ArsA/GET3 family ATPase